MSGVIVCRRVLVGGRVQGVFYRDACRQAAVATGVAGWARNLADGRVEIVLEGEASAVDRMVAWCRLGPPRARVDALEVIEQAPSGARGFRVA